MRVVCKDVAQSSSATCGAGMHRPSWHVQSARDLAIGEILEIVQPQHDPFCGRQFLNSRFQLLPLPLGECVPSGIVCCFFRRCRDAVRAPATVEVALDDDPSEFRQPLVKRRPVVSSVVPI